MAINVAQGPLTDRVRVYDFLKAEIYQPYCRTAGTIKNQGVGAIAAGALQPGYPLVKISEGVWRTALAADAASVNGFFIDERIHEALASAATTKNQYQILERGPAHINTSRIPATDTDGGTLTNATIVTAALALSPPIKKFVEPTTTQTQNT